MDEEGDLVTQWGVVGVIIALVGLFLTVGKPLAKLITAIERLTNTCNQLNEKFDKFELKNKESHKRIWEHNKNQDDIINDHEKRIHALEEFGGL